MPDKCGGEPETKDDEVLTPGGFRPKSLVRELKPGEVLRQEADGTYSIVPDEDKQD